MKNQKGVTLISLVITIILIMILSAISINTGFETYETMRAQAFVAKMIAVQEAVDKLCEEKTIEEINNNLGTDFYSAPQEAKIILKNFIEYASSNEAELNSWDSLVDNSETNYRYFDINNIDTILEIKDFDTAIWVNPKSRNIIAVNGIEYEDVMYYRQYDLFGGQTLVESNSQVEPKSKLKSKLKSNINVDFLLDCAVFTYNNKAEIKLLKDNNVETVFSEVKYYKQKDDGTYGDAISLNNVSKIVLDKSGIYRVEATDSNGNTQTREDIIVTIVNKPLLADGMTPVKFIDNNMIDTSIDDKEWYNYAEDSKKWANARLKDGSVFVWIPRYAYEIIEDSNSSAGSINVKFLKEFSNTCTDGNSLASTYKVVPAFQNGIEIGFENGEWDAEITGFWVAKYEAIKYGDSMSRPPQILASNTESWREITSINAFDYCRYMEGIVGTNDYKNDYFGDTLSAAFGNYNNGLFENDKNNIDTHLMKNSEWGAVVYLSHSKYGAQVVQAKTYNVKTNTEPQYSSTNNYTGVYGLSGGAHDMVAAKRVDSDAFNSERASTKYITVYSSLLEDNTIYGDALKETSNWNNNLEIYPTDTICRGGNIENSNAGIFAYTNIVTNGTSDTTFRPVLIVEY